LRSSIRLEVTAGGFINSPAGALVVSPLAVGKGHFNLNPQYPKGASVPSGQVKFTVNSAGFDFDATALEFLVVAGSKGQLRGSGVVNGGGNYGFLLTVTDGALPGGGGPDKFRIKIWNTSAGDAVVYDNVPGAPDDMDIAAPMAIGQGSITIHKEK
jgi:hypothetical protein